MLRKVENVRNNKNYDDLKNKWGIHSIDDSVVCLGDINGHIGRILMYFMVFTESVMWVRGNWK